MKVQAISINNYKLQNTNVQKQNTAKYQQNPYYSQNKTSFGSALNAADDILYKGILDKGYKFFKNVEIINPTGEKINGYSFIKDISGKAYKREVISIITDDHFYELGQASASTYYMDNNQLICDVINHTNTPLNNFTRTSEIQARTQNDGKYRHVGKNAYQCLEDYVKRTYPEIDRFVANIISWESWEFHCKIGFDGKSGDYDYCSMTNFLEKKIK